MPDPRLVVFGPGDKLRWLEGIAFDEFATPFDCRVAVALTSRVDKYTGVATVSQTWIAEKLDATERGVRQSLERLCARGDLEIAHSRGRGLANQYRLQKSGTPIPLFDPEKRNGATQKGERRDTKRGTGVPPLPKYLPNKSSRDAFARSESVEGKWISRGREDDPFELCLIVPTYSPEWHELVAWHQQRGDVAAARLMCDRAETGTGQWTAPRGWLPASAKRAAE